MTDAVSGMMLDSVNARQMGIRRTLAGTRESPWSCDAGGAPNVQQGRQEVPRRRGLLSKRVSQENWVPALVLKCLGPYIISGSGNKYKLVVSDYFTKWFEAYSVRYMKAKTVAETLVEGFKSRMGEPMIIHSEQGSDFEIRLFQHMCALLGIKKIRMNALSLAANGLVERYHIPLMRYHALSLVNIP